MLHKYVFKIEPKQIDVPNVEPSTTLFIGRSRDEQDFCEHTTQCAARPTRHYCYISTYITIYTYTL